MKKILFIFCIFCNSLNAQDTLGNRFQIGLRMKKYAGFYYVNGLQAQMKSPFSKNGSVYFGLNVGTTLLGSAFNSNALTTWETELSITKLYRIKKIIRPLIRLNSGVVAVHFGEYAEYFQDLPQWGIMSSFETGLDVNLKKLNPHLSAQLIGGIHFYNNGPGVVYPAYYAVSVGWKL